MNRSEKNVNATDKLNKKKANTLSFVCWEARVKRLRAAFMKRCVFFYLGIMTGNEQKKTPQYEQQRQ